MCQRFLHTADEQSNDIPKSEHATKNTKLFPPGTQLMPHAKKFLTFLFLGLFLHFVIYFKHTYPAILIITQNSSKTTWNLQYFLSTILFLEIKSVLLLSEPNFLSFILEKNNWLSYTFRKFTQPSAQLWWTSIYLSGALSEVSLLLPLICSEFRNCCTISINDHSATFTKRRKMKYAPNPCKNVGIGYRTLGTNTGYGDFVSFLVWFPGNLYLPNRGVSYSTISWMTKKQLQFRCFAPKFTSGCEYLLKNTPKYMHQYESEFRWSILIQVINMS